ncbi:MAG: CaiB/BaiF CoA transferase family protein [Magnetospiraceae bacterium]
MVHNRFLEGVRVLDFTRVLSGPYATMVLADMGAEIIKVESLEKGDDTRYFSPFVNGLSHYFLAYNRNKKSVTIDLKSAEGAALARNLAGKSDVVVENFRPGVMEKLGLGYDSLKASNPALVYCAISGFGADGPLRDNPSFDLVAQALSGIMSINCEPGETPTKLGLPLGDLAGGIFGVFGVLGALHAAQKTGIGCKVDISMLDSLLGMLGYLSQLYFVTGKTPQPVGSGHPNIVPYRSFETADGHVIVACLTERFWGNLARALGQPDLIDDPRFQTAAARSANRDALNAIIADTMKTADTETWVEKLTRHDVPHAPLMSVAEALDSVNTKARGMVRTVVHPIAGDVKVVGNPVRQDGVAPPQPTPPPLLGQDTKAVLEEVLGKDRAEIDRLLAAGVIGSEMTS